MKIIGNLTYDYSPYMQERINCLRDKIIQMIDDKLFNSLWERIKNVFHKKECHVFSLGGQSNGVVTEKLIFKRDDKILTELEITIFAPLEKFKVKSTIIDYEVR